MEYNLEKLFASSTIQDDFCNIWTNIIEKVDDIKISVEDAQQSIKNLTLYDILDGSRTTLTSKSFIEPKYDADDKHVSTRKMIDTIWDECIKLNKRSIYVEYV